MKKTVLVIDDDKDILAVFRELAREERTFFVVRATDGRDALEKLKHVNVALILLDLRMPFMSGQDFIKEYRVSGYKQAPIIVFTATPKELIELPISMGEIEYLAKPFEIDDLLSLIARHLQDSEPTTQLPTPNNPIS